MRSSLEMSDLEACQLQGALKMPNGRIPQLLKLQMLRKRKLGQAMSVIFGQTVRVTFGPLFHAEGLTMLQEDAQARSK